MQDADKTHPDPPRSFDAIVVGGGHAGVEAAWALGRLGHTVAVVTFDVSGLSRMPCNPSIGGLAKGQLAREVDALGGLMGRLIDRTGIHFRMLNQRKGPAVHAPRAQADKPAYSRAALEHLSQQSTITLLEAEATEILTEKVPGRRPRVVGVRLGVPDWSAVKSGGAHSSGPVCTAVEPGPRIIRLTTEVELSARVVVVAAGTFLNANIFTGMDPRRGGRRGEPPAAGLSLCLQQLGLRLGRLKTGTPPRLRRSSIDLTSLEAQPGDEPPPRFSFFAGNPVRNQVVCHLTRTNDRTHEVIRGALDRSPLFGGMIKGVGPRYCPSIEDKVVRFPDRTTHQVFLEPEGLEAEEVYPNGISTSLPVDVQEAYVRTIRGMEDAQIVHPGYAVEYDFLLTSQIDSTLEVRDIEGLYAAGQINGTSGYEEAAAQGIMAGLNARAYLEGRPSVVLRRSDAYIGVLVDDLVTKIPTEPYRMFTSQSEYRLLLRQDNADRRLSRIGRDLGLLREVDYKRVRERWSRIEGERERLRSERLDRSVLQRAAARDSQLGSEHGFRRLVLSEKDLGKTFEDLLRRPEVTLEGLNRLGFETVVPHADRTSVEADVKYVGYIQKLMREVEQRRAVEDAVIPESLLLDPPGALSREARERLRAHRPRTLGQASRIPGITPCDVSVLAIRIRVRAGDTR